MEHPSGAAAPGPDAQHPMPNPPAAPSGYGYPPAGGFPPQAGHQQPTFQQQPYPAPGFGPAQGYSQPAEPDWEALASDHEAQARRRKWMWTGGIVLAACVLGGIVGTAVLHGIPGTPGPTGSPTAKPSTSSTLPVNTPTVPGQPNLLADHAGKANATLSPDASVDPVQSGGFALRLRANSNSYAQTQATVVDVTKSFTVSAWVYNEAPDGYRTVISQGSDVGYSFDIGRDDFGGKTVWIFRVQTADGGADATSYHALSPNLDTVGKWVLLTGVYDASQQVISLYVDGAPSASTKVPGVWAAPGGLQFGRNRNHSAWGGYWAGVIGHAQVWDKALTPAQIGTLKDNGGVPDVVPVGSWLVG